MKAIAIKDWNPTIADTTILDVRPTEAFIYGFIPESIHIPMAKIEKYAPLFLADTTQLILVAANTEDAASAATQLEALYPKMDISYLDGGWESFIDSDFESDMIIEIEADEFAMDQQFDKNMVVIDVRNTEQYDAEHVAGAISMPVASFADILHIASVDEDKNVYLHCGGGSSAVMTASLFKKHGLHNIRIIEGGFSAIQAIDKISTVTATKD